MVFTQTKLQGAYIIDVKRLEDERGFFGRSHCRKEFEPYGLNTNVVQANVSYNKLKGTLRGMHMQLSPYEESKLVRCTQGSIFDVIVDMRKSSSTFKQWIGVELTEQNFRMLYVPEGFAHGFITLEDNTNVTYQVTQFYNPDSEFGIRWNDPSLNIEWPIQPLLVSPKDESHPLLERNSI